ncbi:uncharacterized protein EDB91DRAFT_1118498 [Suillus paluster]|uniref:uncharacterized protein n=1 Tax=Suillus paluster TaxID=48578 RepID=UPI001B8637F6|nr:uncharacterized protein EDB91DRAFT_1118498 [Suillus paluster]KAG1746721.1 hypothetical protein EDB91DRAFT_1118498 [Suillus paluster]
MISTMFNGGARLTIIGYLYVANYKEVVLDSTVQLIRDAENVSDLAGIALNFCVSPAILILASNKAARIFLTTFNPSPPFAGDIFTPPNASSSQNVPATEASPITAYSPTPYSLWLHSTPIPRPKRCSLDSDTTVVSHDDDFDKDTPVSDHDSDTDSGDRKCDGDGSTVCKDELSSNPTPGTTTPTPGDSDCPSPQPLPLILLVDNLHQTPSANPDLAAPPGSASSIEALPRTTKPRLKPPGTKRVTDGLLPHPTTALRHQRSHLSKQKYAARLIAARDSIARSHLKQDNIMISHLEQVYDEILVDQAALVDGWATAMAELGLTSMLSPLSLPNTPIPGLSPT